MPPTTLRAAELRLRITTEKQAIARTKRELGQFQNEFKAFKAESETVNRALDTQVRGLQKQRLAAASSEREIQKFTTQQRRAASEADKTTQSLARQAVAFNETKRAAGGSGAAAGGRNVLQRAGTELFRLPSQQLGGGLSTDVLGRLLNTLGGLGAAGTAAALGVGAAVVALKAATTGIEQTVKAIIASQEEYYRALKTGSRESIEAAIEQKRIEIEIARARIAEYRQLFTNLEAQVGGVGRGLSDLLDLGGSRQLREETQRLEEELRALEFGMGRLEQAAESAEVATRDAAEAEKELAAAREAAADARVTALIRSRLQAEKLSADAIKDRIDAIQLEMRLNLEYAQSADISNEKVRELTERNRELAIEFGVLNDALPEKERVEAAAKAMEALRDSIDQFLKDAAKWQAEVRKAVEDIADLWEKFGDRLADIERRRQQAIEDAAYQREQAIVEARRDAAIAEAEAVRKAGLERARIEEESQRNIRRILRRARFDIQNAIQDRDAVALDLARRRRTQELKDEEENKKARLKELDDRLKEELRTIRRRLKEQLRTIDKQYAEQVRRANLAAQRAIEVETLKFQKELQIRQDALYKILNVTAQGKQKEVIIAQNGATAVVNTSAKMWTALVKHAQSALTAVSKAPAATAALPPNSSPAFGKPVPTLDRGGRLTSDGYYYGHKGEYVLNPRKGQMPGLTFNLNGMNRREIHRELDRALDDFVLENF